MIDTPQRTAGVLICGLPRSGTSLTRGLIGSHPAFAVPRHEMNWWVTLYPRYRGDRDARRWRRFVRDLLEAPSTRTLELDRDALARRLQDVSVGEHIAAFAAVLSAFADAWRRPRWGEKTLLAEFCARDVLAALPGAKVIHLIRDPRDVFTSFLHAPWRTATSGRRTGVVFALRGQMAWVLRNWTASSQLARAHAARFPDRYLVLRYETLVRDPRHEVERLCGFLGERFEPAMLELGAYPDLVDRGGNSSFGRLAGISTVPIGRFQTVLTPRQIALCDALAGEELERNGYQRGNVTLSHAEVIRLNAVDRLWSKFVGLVHAGAFHGQGIPRA